MQTDMDELIKEFRAWISEQSFGNRVAHDYYECDYFNMNVAKYPGCPEGHIRYRLGCVIKDRNYAECISAEDHKSARVKYFSIVAGFVALFLLLRLYVYCRRNNSSSYERED